MRTLRDRLRMHHGSRSGKSPGESEAQNKGQIRDNSPLPPKGFAWRGEGEKRYLYRRQTFPLTHGRGKYVLGDLDSIAPFMWPKEKQERDAAATGKREELLFFDTETTGLGTGAGNLIFLIGAGYFHEDGFVLEHYLLPDASREVPMLRDFWLQAQSFSGIVTYNGKGFDWNQLKARFQMNRLPWTEHHLHCDLLYPVRRLWRTLLPSCRLQTVESACLGIERVDDVPGFLAPQMYVEYVHTRQPEPIEGVVRHNEQDVLTLVHLFTHLQQVLAGEIPMEHPEEKLAAGKWWLERGDLKRGTAWIQSVLGDADASIWVRRQAYSELTLWLKKRQSWEEAVGLWESWRREDRWNIQPYVELAKYYEHKALQVEKALVCTEEAIDLIRRRKRLVPSPQLETQLEELQYRAERLRRKREGRLF
ncbi:ribonuclease H-like domain-containing protein [Marinithermofilum abyssi]|nr:ribonuclease H-like domain-containing protein [Marinithermofilum abyssi]